MSLCHCSTSHKIVLKTLESSYICQIHSNLCSPLMASEQMSHQSCTQRRIGWHNRYTGLTGPLATRHMNLEFWDNTIWRWQQRAYLEGRQGWSLLQHSFWGVARQRRDQLSLRLHLTLPKQNHRDPFPPLDLWPSFLSVSFWKALHACSSTSSKTCHAKIMAKA